MLVKPEAKQMRNSNFMLRLGFRGRTVKADIDNSLALVVNYINTANELNATLRAGAWNSVCVGVSVTHATHTQEEDQQDLWIYKVWVSLHGRRHDTTAGGFMSGWQGWQNGMVVCFSNNFTGMVTGLTLLKGKEVEEEEEGGRMRIPADCSALVARNVLTHPLDDSWFLKNYSLTLEEELPEDPCLRTPPQTVRLQGPGGYQAFLWLCRSLGGDLPTRVDDMMMEHNCSTGKYLTWASRSVEMGAGSDALCPVLLAGGGAGQLPCLNELDCAFCLVPEGLTYTLFGQAKGFDRHYTLRTLLDGTFDFQGMGTSVIYQGALGWTLGSRHHNEEFHQRLWVMGRRRWYRTGLGHLTNAHTCTDNSKNSDTHTASKLLTFTVCNALYFSSDDGECLLRREMCDLGTNSSGWSDQRNCKTRIITDAEDYDTQYGPFTRVDQQSFSYEIKVRRIFKISTVEGKATLQLHILFTWQDLHLKHNSLDEARLIPCGF
ncbi:uncharacterized protein LOC126983435 [Eriocheir sinensis]|uniref:uncharacterized protein LOC126983435 n=1 Tax=Eriocheir sinensis TaxID=95602 RepID=UPI0021C77612|nr:uncharacterized protein LOC126983435 [Eriocheir sinensis]